MSEYPVGKTIDELKVGDSASLSKAFSQEDINDFARISGDVNPVHLDKEWAEQTMFKGRIAHGLMTAGLLSAIFGTKLPGTGAIYMSQSLKWLAPVYPGDELTATVTVKEIVPEKNRAVFDTVVKCGDKDIIVGEALIMPRKAD